MSPTFLFDFDGTLLVDNVYEPQAQSLREAVEIVYDVPAEPEAVDWVGKTDLQLAREYVLLGSGDFDERRQAYIDCYVDIFRKRVPTNLVGRVRTGMRTVLQWARDNGSVRLVTGNIRPVAELKLRAARLDEYVDLEMSAFGDQGERRSDLVSRAAYPDEEQTILLGDTHRDISAAIEAGVASIGVITPKHDHKELVNADYVCYNIADVMDALREFKTKMAAAA